MRGEKSGKLAALAAVEAAQVIGVEKASIAAWRAQDASTVVSEGRF